MDNLVAMMMIDLPWLGMCGVCFVVLALLKIFNKLEKVRTQIKGYVLGLLVCTILFTMDAVPTIWDFLTHETITLTGTVIEETVQSHKFALDTYKYTIQTPDGESVDVYVHNDYLEDLGLDVGQTYQVSCYKHSMALKEAVQQDVP